MLECIPLGDQIGGRGGRGGGWSWGGGHQRSEGEMGALYDLG